MKFGTIIASIDAVPRALWDLDGPVSPADLNIIADHLAHVAAQVRTIAQCQVAAEMPAPRPATLSLISDGGQFRHGGAR